MVVGSVEGLLDPRSLAGRGGDNAAVVTCTSMASSNNFISAAVIDIYRPATVLLIDCIISVHKINVSPGTTFTADMCWLYGRCHATAALARRLTTYYRTLVYRHNPGNTALFPQYHLAGKILFVVT